MDAVIANMFITLIFSLSYKEKTKQNKKNNKQLFLPSRLKFSQLNVMNWSTTVIIINRFVRLLE